MSRVHNRALSAAELQSFGDELDAIRARADGKAAVPIIVITADTALDLRERCIAAGADEVLFKPVAMDALFEAMGRILARDADGGMLV